jgi:hypothetical protein
MTQRVGDARVCQITDVSCQVQFIARESTKTGGQVHGLVLRSPFADLVRVVFLMPFDVKIRRKATRTSSPMCQ